MKSVAKYRESKYDKQHGAGAHRLVASGQVHRGLSPEDILITPGGGDAGGDPLFHCVVEPAAARSCSVGP